MRYLLLMTAAAAIAMSLLGGQAQVGNRPVTAGERLSAVEERQDMNSIALTTLHSERISIERRLATFEANLVTVTALTAWNNTMLWGLAIGVLVLVVETFIRVMLAKGGPF